MNKFVALFVGVCAAISLLGPIAAADQITLQPGPTEGKDIWTTSVFSSAPGGGGPGGGLDDDRLLIGGWGDTYISLLEFDLSSLPDQALSVTLQLYSGPPSPIGVGKTRVFLDRITEFWDWRTQGTGADHERLWWADRPAAVALSGPLANPLPGEWYSIDITDLYNAWQSGLYPNCGLQLRPESTNNRWSVFHSSDYLDDPSLRPKLVIDYNPAMPTIASPIYKITPTPCMWQTADNTPSLR